MICEAVGPVAHARINFNAAQANEIVAAVSGRKLRILAMVLSNNHASNDVIVTVQDNTGTPVVLMGPIRIPPGLPVVLPFNGAGWAEAAAGKSINILSDGTEVVAGSITYQLVGSRAAS